MKGRERNGGTGRSSAGGVLAQGQAGEELAEADEVRGDVAAGDDEGDGEEDEENAEADARREGLVEDEHAEKDGGEGFQGAKDGGGRGTDKLDGPGGAKERDGRGEQRQGEEVAPVIPYVGEDKAFSEIHTDEEERQAEDEHVKRDGQRGDAFQPRTVDGHDIDGVGDGRGQHEQHAHEVQRGTVLPLVEQGDAAKGKGDAGDGEQREAFVEDERHDEGHENGVDKEERGGYARRHVVVALEKGERGDGYEQPHDNERENLPALQSETSPPRFDHEGEDGDGEEVTEKENRVGVHARLVKRQGKQRIHSVSGGSDGPDGISFSFCVHKSNFRATNIKENAIGCQIPIAPVLFNQREGLIVKALLRINQTGFKIYRDAYRYWSLA